MSSRELTIHLRNEESPSSSASEHDIITSKLSSETIPSNDTLVSTIKIDIESIALYDPLSLASLVTSLCKDGSGQITLQIDSNADTAPLHTSIMLAGLTPQSEKTNDGKCSITAIYKPKSKNSSASIKRNIRQKIKPVKINLGELKDEDDIIDEDDLLSSTPNGINAPEEVDVAERKKQLDDCGGRKACDDCTCGRKEMEEGANEGESKSAVIDKSACGNCAKGDAFRCAGCPFLGKPAFKEGEEHLVLDLTDDL
jgi:hypothetical protein